MAKETTENKVVPAADDSTKNKNQNQTQTLEHEDNSSTVTQNGAAAKEPAEVIEAHQDGDEKDDQEQVKAETVTDTEEATEAKEETKSSKSKTSEPVGSEEPQQLAKATEEPTKETKPKEAEPKETKTSETKITLKKTDQLDQESDDSRPAKKSASQTRKVTSDDQVNPGEKPIGEVFILVRPFVRFGRYIRDSWREIRQVRWPNRKATWKMVLAVIGYCIIFMAFLLVLDLFFTWLFNLLLNK